MSGDLQILYQLSPQLVERSISFAKSARSLLTNKADTIYPKAACSSSSSLFCSFLQGDFEFSQIDRKPLMEFYDVLNQALTLLEREKRVSYRALKRQFSIDDEYIEDLKAEIIDAKQLAIDEDGKVLVWTGNGSLESGVQSLESKTAHF